MTQRLRLTRTSYAISLALYVVACILLPLFADELGLQRYFKSINTALSTLFIVASTGRLIDAGFGFWRSFLCITLFLFILPLMVFFGYLIFFSLPPARADADALIFNAVLIGGIGLQIIVAAFCFLFPSAEPKASSQDDPLNWKPPGYMPVQERREPRF